MLERIPRRLGTALILFGVVVMPVCYYAISLMLRREAACAGADARCLADALFWRDLATAGFVAALAIGTIGVVLDLLRKRR